MKTISITLNLSEEVLENLQKEANATGYSSVEKYLSSTLSDYLDFTVNDKSDKSEKEYLFNVCGEECLCYIDR